MRHELIPGNTILVDLSNSEKKRSRQQEHQMFELKVCLKKEKRKEKKNKKTL